MSVTHTTITNGDNGKTKEVELNPLKAIRLHCLECVGFSYDEVKRCSHSVCPLHPFRFGKDPGRKRELTDEQRQAAADRLKAARTK